MSTEERFQRLRDALSNAGHRPTAVRERLLRAFVASGRPVSVRELQEREGGGADTVTAYRLMDHLTTLGLAVRFVRAKNAFAFALRDEMDDHVHYIVCERCGHSEPFRGCVVGKYLEANPTPRGFWVEHHLLTMHGICRVCQKVGNGTSEKARPDRRIRLSGESMPCRTGHL